MKIYRPFAYLLIAVSALALSTSCSDSKEKLLPCWECTRFVVYTRLDPSATPPRDYTEERRFCSDADKDAYTKPTSETFTGLNGPVWVKRTQTACAPSR